MVLLVSCLSQIKTGIDSLQSKIDKMELQYANAKSKTEQKELIQEIEDFEKESKYSEILQEAEGFQYVVEVNIADTKIKLRKVQLKLKLPVQCDISEESTSTSGESNRTTNPAREIEEIPEENRRCRLAKPPPKFYGNQEEFPEYWALYESLIDNCNELTTIEKIVLLKESLKGPAEA
ncbi:hypothetical protein Y032_0022g494 [Ancylostoma ceylanicum]|uniref:Uncharacterized protein n=1 Tax=Ancylostoma ceylanicum TaxID=53326 RepID=A0A016UZG1_9BILA|nr:hypothetical protein Y032_0022g494 [Ancylostoma ceylanicum]